AGPLQLTVADVAVVAQSHFGLTGAAISIGEQPVKTLLNPAAMARLSVGEALTNMVWAKISALEDIKCSGNWMWAAKLPGEGVRLYDAAVALSEVLTKLGIAIDGGKDSLSMAAQVSKGDQGEKNKEQKPEETETVKSPGTLVISAYATCPDVTKVITPDLKGPGESRLMLIDLGKGKNRLGGSALAQVFSQIGQESPDMDDTDLFQNAFRAVQRMISDGLILSGHDRSDGGLITTLLEMACAGNCGIEVELRVRSQESRVNNQYIAAMFSEELGLVIEYLPDREEGITSILNKSSIDYQIIGTSLREKKIMIKARTPDSQLLTLLDEDMRNLRTLWEETSYQLEKLQTNPECAEEERRNIFDREAPKFALSFTPEITPVEILNSDVKHKIAIIREEGSNSDREMSGAFFQAGFEPWDVTMTDLLEGQVSLSDFRGLAFVGGFSYADVLDSAKGWAGVIRFNEKIWEEFQAFYNRGDTFSLGICNGCQLMALLGWVPWQGLDTAIQPRFVHNLSGRFESRFASVRILPGPSIMLKGMEDSVLGIWVAHGEGRAYFPEGKILKKVEEHNLAQIRYVDDGNQITGKYPFNPNGSINGIASLCSVDGRHLAIMPHPERTFLKWQWPWMPEDWKKDLQSSPWLTMFQNARQWCESTDAK
ncbi:MAG: phosphoribosylformylglycinamidine synthase subunit PurQ, partial [Nitrospiraceae bacterium]